MSGTNQAPIGAATAAVEAARRLVGVADRHLLDALDHLAAAAETLDALTASRAVRDAPEGPGEGTAP
jgi:hypothetical protein